MAYINVISNYGTISSYSSQNDLLPAANVIAGSSTWRTEAGNYDLGWVIIDLHDVFKITRFKAWSTGMMHPDTSVKNYKILVSDTDDEYYSFTEAVVGQIAEPAVSNYTIIPTFHEVSIDPVFARYIKYKLDSNWKTVIWSGDTVASMRIEAYADVDLSETATFSIASKVTSLKESATFNSDSEVIDPTEEEGQTFSSDASVTDELDHFSIDAAVSNQVLSDAYIIKGVQDTALSDAMIWRSGASARGASIIGAPKPDEVNPDDYISTSTFPVLVYSTDISMSDDVIVPDMITSSLMDMQDIAPPLGYSNYDWKYDWVVRTYNGAHYRFEARSGETSIDLQAATFFPITLNQIIPRYLIHRYHQWRCHIWASGPGDFELHQFSIKGYIDYPANPLYSSLNPEVFTSVSNVKTHVERPYEPMDMSQLWGGTYIPGDLDADSFITNDDYIYLNNYLSGDGDAPTPLLRADVNASGDVTDADLIYLNRYLFSGSAPPPYRVEGDFN